MFVGSDRGGDRAAIFYTLIDSAKFNGLDPEAYAFVGSAVVGGTAWSRMWAFVPPPYQRGIPENSVSVPMIGVARNS
jgi:hypothetical protein